MFSAQTPPIAIDFGSSSVKLLQITPGENPSIQAAVGLRIPDAIRLDRDGRIQYLEKQLPRMFRKGGFKGRRVICSVPSVETLVQHLQVSNIMGVDREEAIKEQFAAQRGLSPHNMVIRTYEVTEVHRDGQPLSEVICFAISREAVMRYVELLDRCKLEAVGVHSEIIGVVRAFDHLQPRPEEPSVTTLYVDMGWGSTKVAISHDALIVFARCIQIGGQHLDKRLADRLGCDLASARAQRISEQVLATSSPGSSSKKAKSAAVATSEESGVGAEAAEIAHALAEELSMCVRYHESLFRGQKIDRVIFLGGEARDVTLCQAVARELRLPAQLGDPLTRFGCKRSLRTPGLSLGQPQPGWAVVCGLCTAPTDL
ncbi:MAG: pilus assembly protein PilM [Planctomycetota bacterium]|jgi:Tfp pilus assembly PilM family ATPase